MKKRDYRLWVAYRCGLINRKLTEHEYNEIRACEFAMHLLIPTNRLLKICGGLDNLKSMNIYHNYSVIKKLAKKFKVPEEVMFFKLDYLIKNNIGKNKTKSKKKILKKEDNVVYVDFN